jgi:hypothetical protein
MGVTSPRATGTWSSTRVPISPGRTASFQKDGYYIQAAALENPNNNQIVDSIPEIDNLAIDSGDHSFGSVLHPQF